MKTYPLRNENGDFAAFEISNACFISSGAVARYLDRCPGVSVTKVRRRFDSGNEIHVQFSFKGETFEVWEPFGDNSRYWIGPSSEPQRRRECIDELEAYVRNSWPGPISAACGWLLSLFRRRASG